MNALLALEGQGFRFELSAEGVIAYHYAGPDDADGAMEKWAGPLLAEIAGRRAEAVAVLRHRQAWITVYDEWSARLAEESDDPQRDIDYLRRLMTLAIDGHMPCYDGGPDDLGAAGWRRVTDRQIQAFRDLSGPYANPVSHKEKDEMGIKIEQTTFEAVPTGDYKAVITDIAAVEGKFGPQLQIKCEINDGPYAGNTFLCWVSPKFSPKSRLYEWVEAALAMTVPKTYTFDSDHLIGREVVATLVVRALDGGGEVNRVDRVRKVTSDE